MAPNRTIAHPPVPSVSLMPPGLDSPGQPRPDRPGPGAAARAVRIAAVSYLNTLPLIEGLDRLAGLDLHLAPPARLAGLLAEGRADLALASVIDAQTAEPPLAMVRAGMIGCDGPTLTVRLFSRVPIPSITRVHADVESHTSVALLRVLLLELHGLRPEIVGLDAHALAAPAQVGAPAPESMLLIGDKVIAPGAPWARFEHQLDLGEAWKALTGLPFVYAVWMCRADQAASEAVRTAAALVDRQRRRNAARLEWLIARRAPEHAWPIDLARRYLGQLLRYELTDAHAAGIERFFDLCAQAGVMPARRASVWA